MATRLTDPRELGFNPRLWQTGHQPADEALFEVMSLAAADPEAFEAVFLSLKVAFHAHTGQLHRGLPYITHPIGAAWQAISPRAMDLPVWPYASALLLHDGPEDNPSGIAEYFANPFRSVPRQQSRERSPEQKLHIAREIGFRLISSHIGSSVEEIVREVTGPEVAYHGPDNRLRLADRMQTQMRMIRTPQGLVAKAADGFAHGMFVDHPPDVSDEERLYLSDKNFGARTLILDRFEQPDVLQLFSEAGSTYTRDTLRQYLSHSAA